MNPFRAPRTEVLWSLYQRMLCSDVYAEDSASEILETAAGFVDTFLREAPRSKESVDEGVARRLRRERTRALDEAAQLAARMNAPEVSAAIRAHMAENGT